MENERKQSKARKIVNIVLVTIITFVINFIGSAAAAIAFSVVYIARGVDVTNPESMMGVMTKDPSLLMFSTMYNLLAIALVFIFWKYVDKQNVQRLGFARTSKTGIQVFWGIIAAIAAMTLIIIFGITFKIIRYEGLGTIAFAPSQIIASLIIGIITFLMVGFGEEAVYRSYIQNHLLDIAGSRYGLTIAALIFTGVHLFTYGKVLDLLDVFLAGLILGYAFILTKSIYLPAAFHFMWDYLQLSIFRLQDYEYFTGPVLVIFNNVGDLIVGGYNLGNKLEIGFIAVEIMILSLMFVYREKIAKLEDKTKA